MSASRTVWHGVLLFIPCGTKIGGWWAQFWRFRTEMSQGRGFTSLSPKVSHHQVTTRWEIQVFEVPAGLLGQFFWAGCCLILNGEIQEIQLLVFHSQGGYSCPPGLFAKLQLLLSHCFSLLFPSCWINTANAQKQLNNLLPWCRQCWGGQPGVFVTALRDRTFSLVSPGSQQGWSMQWVHAQTPWDPLTSCLV